MATKVKGKIVRSDLDGGYWTLETDDGDVYKIEGGDAALLKAGVKAEIEGDEGGGMGIGFGTPVLKVKHYKII